VIVRPEAVPDVAAAVAGAGAKKVLSVGGRTKPALWETGQDEAALMIDTGSLRGVVAYDPGELTFTAQAGTPMTEVDAVLAEHGQYLPLDPPMRAGGSTLGGVVAAGLPGSGAFGSGIVRDFIIGIRVVDGRGNLISGGGRVVKNAAGFDLPKLMVGSVGRLGVITEVTFKVFPRPAAAATVAFESDSLAASTQLLVALGRSPLAIAALDLEPPGRVLVRLEGPDHLLDERIARLQRNFDLPSERLTDADQAALWERAVECTWAPDEDALVVAPLTIGDLGALDSELDGDTVERRYSLAGRLAWIAWPRERRLDELGDLLGRLGLCGLPLRGSSGPYVMLGAARRNAFADRVRKALDPDRRFLEIWP
jgi:glycolate oxidase FAD binding subunit